ncbi:hypothetical protein RM844_27850 [Streptomyces sp. DSM 44915]|uniref:ABC transporter permease n=1 Tax=Streptomyces chisholmiae TaxID=3075540 RepID=A0ABU2JYK7_9ACTN|nr:hypothetical protein [Streptomyces sp. DSM 44915]MDT0270093.1 hypothetical protein [Streptomyces sp. DSM 44915]
MGTAIEVRGPRRSYADRGDVALPGAPLVLVGGSALAVVLLVPLEVLPETVAQVCGLLPLTPSVDLIGHGWLGGLDGAELTRAWLLALAWVAAGVFAVRRWFRWDPRQ